MAENVRKTVEALRIKHAGNQPHGKVTISIGFTTIPTGSSGEAVMSVVHEADQALYLAKAAVVIDVP